MSTIARKFALAFLTILAASAAQAQSIDWLTDSTTGYDIQITGSSVNTQAFLPESADSPSGLWNFGGGEINIDYNYSPGEAHLLGGGIYISLLAERNGAFIFNTNSVGTIENYFPDQNIPGSVTITLPLSFHGFTPSIGTSWTTANSLTISWDSSLSNGFNYVADFSASGPAAVDIPEPTTYAMVIGSVCLGFVMIRRRFVPSFDKRC
jgi:hypothetical protein